ncbi:hypothetical protein [Glycomyces terrestris]|uniref:DUF3558 domain-containing protein n=1 Tax=Glycomyces terrestris TaxID=2493553 RepID=A0A426US86_9ACTN|nr:hypothetical protein [Glycomyces terrestris]RRR95866.1 hypothetical protein EIW28_23575 [Glycomyces terrestris]
MTYPSQPGYPSPYGQQQLPPGRQQSSLWLIGGSIILVLIILMTVILLVVQQTQNNDSADGGSGDGGDGDGGYTEMEAAPFDGTACAQFDPSAFADEVGDTIDDSMTSNSSSSGYVNCTFYTTDKFIYLNATFNDYDTAEEAQSSIDYYRDTYGSDSEYESGDYTELGDDGFHYTDASDPSYQTTDLRIATGSLEIALWVSYDATETDFESVLAGMGEIAAQGDALFVDQQ